METWFQNIVNVQNAAGFFTSNDHIYADVGVPLCVLLLLVNE